MTNSNKSDRIAALKLEMVRIEILIETAPESEVSGLVWKLRDIRTEIAESNGYVKKLSAEIHEPWWRIRFGFTNPS